MGSSDKNPNPQGKGLVPVLQDWGAMRPSGDTARDPASFLRDYCFSSLVLGAHFKFRPVVGKTYYLYAGQPEWTLSLVAPAEWGNQAPGEFLAPCRLRPDMCWEIDAAALGDAPALARLQDFVAGFVEVIRAQSSISDALPYYVGHLPYYQRMLATGLSASLAASGVSTEQVRELAHSPLALPGMKG